MCFLNDFSFENLRESPAFRQKPRVRLLCAQISTSFPILIVPNAILSVNESKRLLFQIIKCRAILGH